MGSNTDRGKNYFSSPERPGRVWGPPTWGINLTNHLTAKVKNEWSSSPITPILPLYGEYLTFTLTVCYDTSHYINTFFKNFIILKLTITLMQDLCVILKLYKPSQ